MRSHARSKMGWRTRTDSSTAWPFTRPARSRPDGVLAMREPDLSSDGPAKLPVGGKLSERDRRLAHVVWRYDARDARSWRAWNVALARSASGDRGYVCGFPMQPTIIRKTQAESTDDAQFGPRVLRVEDMRHELPSRECVSDLLPGLSRVC